LEGILFFGIKQSDLFGNGENHKELFNRAALHGEMAHVHRQAMPARFSLQY
jgi:hypothetical protein